MDRAEFTEFIRRQQANNSAEEPLFDPNKQLDEWRTHLQALYANVKAFMAPYLEKDTAKVLYSDIELNEEFSGPYKVQQLSLVIGRSTIVFQPIGTMLIGSKGRVDVRGPRGTARLGLVNSKIDNARQMIRVTVHVAGSTAPPSASRSSNEPIEWVWKIITPKPDMRFFELNEGNFFDMVFSVADA